MRLRSVRPAAIFGALALLACGSAVPHDATTGFGLDDALAASWDTLEVQVVGGGPEDARGGHAIVFLHGYGGNGGDLVALAHAIAGPDTRVFLPTAVLPHASGRGAMWWEFLEDDWPRPAPDGTSETEGPASKQLPRARQAVLDLIARVRRDYAPDSLALAGYSQGAMLALDVASQVDPPVDQVAAVAGYVLRDSLPALRREGVVRPPVLIVHGRRDEVVWFAASEQMQALLEAAGWPVEAAPHDGSHAIPAGSVEVLRRFLRPPVVASPAP